MKIIFISGLLIASINLADAEVVVRPTYPGTNIPNPMAPALVEERGTIYESYPATTIRDYSKSAYVREGNTVYETFPGTNIPNKMEGGYSIEER
jgi:hypothetical protein